MAAIASHTWVCVRVWVLMNEQRTSHIILSVSLVGRRSECEPHELPQLRTNYCLYLYYVPSVAETNYYFHFFLILLSFSNFIFTSPAALPQPQQHNRHWSCFVCVLFNLYTYSCMYTHNTINNNFFTFTRYFTIYYYYMAPTSRGNHSSYYILVFYLNHNY